MPVFRIDNKLVFFAHVPKCAGTSIEVYLEKRFGDIGMIDTQFMRKAPQQRWSRTSPQHVDTATLTHLLPLSFFHAIFTVVRHPVDRLISVFRFQRDVEKALPELISFDTWLDEVALYRSRNPFYLDNHPRPMSDLVPGAATVFRLEDGLQAVIDWLDDLAGDQAGPREMPQVNNYLNRTRFHKIETRPVEVSNEARARITELFAMDFERFGYDPQARGLEAAQ